MQCELFTLVVKAGETKDIEIPFGANIVLSNAALEGAATKESATVVLNHMENHLALCTLTAGVLPQYRMNVLVTQPEDEDEGESDENENKSEDEEKELPAPSITVKGKGTVHIVGKYVAAGDLDDGDYDDEDMDDEDMDDEDMDDEEDDE